ncbi:hypothetical protein [Streptomyces sp. NPDC007905]|uniref:hypothetical protein n=1 Tax=Streptomyces sp. NPDC007905 TaxID=3364788 RepID=UPI0036E478F9
MTLKGYTGMRWGTVGPETEFARPGAILAEHQLYELDSGELVRRPPKDDSYRTIDAMDWLSALVADHIARTKPPPCPCHGKRYVFRGQGTARTCGHQGAKLVDVTRRAGVSTGTASCVLNHPERVRRTPATEWNSPSLSWTSDAVDTQRLVNGVHPRTRLAYLAATPGAALAAVWLAATGTRRLVAWRQR